jgi:hypothetical protein
MYEIRYILPTVDYRFSFSNDLSYNQGNKKKPSGQGEGIEAQFPIGGIARERQ